MTDLIDKIYIDQQQCEKFGSEYFSGCSLVVSCRDLRNSKRYDTAHNKLFDVFPDSIFYLRREEVDAPGWYSWALF